MVRTEHDLRRSFAQGWIERRAGQLLAHVPGKGIEKHALGGRQLAISGAATPEPAAVSNRLPVPPIYLIRGASRTPTGPPALVMAPSSL